MIKFDDTFTISTMLAHNTETMKHRLRKLLDIYADMKRADLESEQQQDSRYFDSREDDEPWSGEFRKRRLV